jgi:hypothetical protein
MGILVAAFATLLIACYDPLARDCTVSCSTNDTCGTGQVCGGDGFCAGPAVRCQRADAPIVSPLLVTLQIVISGRGNVTVDGIGVCDSNSTSHGSCTFAVPAHVARQLRAIENHGREFVMWTAACSGAATTCSITPVLTETRVGAKFE